MPRLSTDGFKANRYRRWQSKEGGRGACGKIATMQLFVSHLVVI
jgi:hypothetical protein